MGDLRSSAEGAYETIVSEADEVTAGSVGGDQEEEAADKWFLQAADTDADQKEEIAPAPELTFDEKVADLEYAVTRQSLNRDILYAVLGFCGSERTLRETEEFIQARVDFKMATLSPYHLIQILVKHHGLREELKDAQGKAIAPESLEELTEDEADDLIEEQAYSTTEVGMAFYEQHLPALRIAELMQNEPTRMETFDELLRFCAEQPRTYMQIADLLKGRDVLLHRADGTPENIQPSVFMDRLQRAGAVIWDEGWKITEEGKTYLDQKTKQ